jgi:hypothetical protein
MDLVGPAGFNRFRRAVSENGAGTEDLQAVITRFFDDFLLEMTQTYAVRQVVLVPRGSIPERFGSDGRPRHAYSNSTNLESSRTRTRSYQKSV